MRVARRPQHLLASSSLTWKHKDSPCGWFVFFFGAVPVEHSLLLLGRGRHRCWGRFYEGDRRSVLIVLALIIILMWLEVAIKESDGLIAVVSEKYMNSTYCNDGMRACTQRYTTHRRSCLQRWSWQRAQDCSFSRFCFEVSEWY